MKQKFIDYFAGVAELTAHLSSAEKLKVGAIIVKDNRIISVGYNGMPSGWSNECEEWIPLTGVNFEVAEEDREVYCTQKTKAEVLHAETNAISKVARSSESCEHADLFCTHTPCIECAKLIYQSGIRHVYITNKYTASKGCGEQFLIDSGIEVTYVHGTQDNL